MYAREKKCPIIFVNSTMIAHRARTGARAMTALRRKKVKG